jgi:hypothetical protein
MDKKSETRIHKQRRALGTNAAPAVAPAAPTVAPAAPVGAAAQPSTGWWMYHGDPAHTGFVSKDLSGINSSNAGSLKTLFTLELDGPVLSVPAIVEGFIYVGIANSHKVKTQNGGSFYRLTFRTGRSKKRLPGR